MVNDCKDRALMIVHNCEWMMVNCQPKRVDDGRDRNLKIVKCQ